MKKSIYIVFILLIANACEEYQQPEPSGDSWDDVKDQGYGTLTALYVPAEGFAYEDEDGQLTGVTVELLNNFAHFLSDEYDVLLQLDFVEEEDWSRFYQRIADGDDGLIGFGNVTITEDRKKELAFSPPYMTNIASLITHEDADELPNFEQMSETFSGLDGLAFEGTLHEERLRDLLESYHSDADIEMASSNDEIIDRISEENRYFAYIDIYNYWRAVDRGAPIKRHGAGDKASEQFGYIMPLETSWEEIVTEYFKHDDGLLQSEEYSSIMVEHLGENLATLLMEAHTTN